jgi:hypothetical protein
MRNKRIKRISTDSPLARPYTSRFSDYLLPFPFTGVITSSFLLKHGDAEDQMSSERKRHKNSQERHTLECSAAASSFSFSLAALIRLLERRALSDGWELDEDDADDSC